MEQLKATYLIVVRSMFCRTVTLTNALTHTDVGMASMPESEYVYAPQHGVQNMRFRPLFREVPER